MVRELRGGKVEQIKKEGSVNEDKRVTAQEGDGFEVKSKTHRQKKSRKGRLRQREQRHKSFRV